MDSRYPYRGKTGNDALSDYAPAARASQHVLPTVL